MLMCISFAHSAFAEGFSQKCGAVRNKCYSIQSTSTQFYLGDFQNNQATGIGVAITRDGRYVDGKFLNGRATYYDTGRLNELIMAKKFAKLQFNQRKYLQRALKVYGYYNGTVDGVWGRNTAIALLKYAFHKIPRSGWIYNAENPQKLYAKLINTGSKNAATTKKKASSQLIESELRQLKNQLSAANRQISTLNDEVRKEQLAHTQTKSKRNAENAQNQTNLKKEQDKYSGLRSVNKKLRADVTRLNKELQNHNTDAKVVTTATQLALNFEIEQLQEKLLDFEKLETVNKVLKAELAKLKSELSTLRSTTDNTIASLNNELAALDKSNANLSQEVKKVEASSATNTSAITFPSEWNKYDRFITPQQMRFCSILDDYKREKNEAEKSKNQIKQNNALKDRDDNITALLSVPGKLGSFTDWIGLIDRVFVQQSLNPATNKIEAAAGVIIGTPCDITMGSGRLINNIEGTKAVFKQLAFPGTPIYTQLEDLSAGDAVLFNGSFLKSETMSEEAYITNDLGITVKTEAYIKPDDAPDIFIDISYLAKAM